MKEGRPSWIGRLLGSAFGIGIGVRREERGMIERRRCRRRTEQKRFGLIWQRERERERERERH